MLGLAYNPPIPDTCDPVCFSSQFNPFPAKGFPIDEYNRLALDRVKSISALSAHSAVKGLKHSWYVHGNVRTGSTNVSTKRETTTTTTKNNKQKPEESSSIRISMSIIQSYSLA